MDVVCPNMLTAITVEVDRYRDRIINYDPYVVVTLGLTAKDLKYALMAGSDDEYNEKEHENVKMDDDKDDSEDDMDEYDDDNSNSEGRGQGVNEPCWKFHQAAHK